MQRSAAEIGTNILVTWKTHGGKICKTLTYSDICKRFSQVLPISVQFRKQNIQQALTCWLCNTVRTGKITADTTTEAYILHWLNNNKNESVSTCMHKSSLNHTYFTDSYLYINCTVLMQAAMYHHKVEWCSIVVLCYTARHTDHASSYMRHVVNVIIQSTLKWRPLCQNWNSDYSIKCIIYLFFTLQI